MLDPMDLPDPEQNFRTVLLDIMGKKDDACQNCARKTFP